MDPASLFVGDRSCWKGTASGPIFAHRYPVHTPLQQRCPGRYAVPLREWCPAPPPLAHNAAAAGQPLRPMPQSRHPDAPGGTTVCQAGSIGGTPPGPAGPAPTFPDSPATGQGPVRPVSQGRFRLRSRRLDRADPPRVVSGEMTQATTGPLCSSQPQSRSRGISLRHPSRRTVDRRGLF